MAEDLPNQRWFVVHPSGKPRCARGERPAAALTPLADISVAQWRALSERAAEPNGYYLPDWELAVNAFGARPHGASALVLERAAASLTGLVPVISMWRAYRIPCPLWSAPIPMARFPRRCSTATWRR